MPQMAPIAWLSLFIFFTIIFMMFMIMNYFCFMPNSPKSKMNLESSTSKSLNWKW